MAIDITELNEWIKTEEGEKWGSEYKSALLKNRDNLLSDIKFRSSKLSEAEQRLVEIENELSAERAALSKFLVDNELCRLLKNVNVVEPLIPAIIETIKTAYGVSVKANGNERTVSGKLKDSEGKEVESSLESIVDAWKALPESLSVRMNYSSGGGATGGTTIRTYQQDMSKLSGREIVNTSDADFEQWRQQELNKVRS